MRLGDSITVGLAYYGGMVKRFPQFQWVGSQIAGAPMSPNADGLHEGHGGWSTAGILQHIDEWLTSSHPNIVLLMIGTNDIGSKFPLNQATDRLEQIATKIVKTGAQLAIAMIPPLKQWKPEIDVKPYNDFIVNLVDKLSKLGYNVSLVDVGWDESDISSDKLHPNPKGYRKFADAYAKVLEGKTYPKPSTDVASDSSQAGGIQWGKAALGAAAVLGIYRFFF
jgi:lysophospholipase L1-like esterase